MHEIHDLILERLQYITDLKAEKIKALKKAPGGKLRISYHKEKDAQFVQYYHRQASADKNGSYLPVSKKDLARRLAQKEYDEKILRLAEQEEKAIQKYLAADPPLHVEDLYERMPALRRELVAPVRETDETFIAQWCEKTFAEKSNYNDSFLTDLGEKVRSKSEVIIANALAHESIPYHYEYPLYLEGIGTIRPDFTILNVRLRKEIIWEHFGLMDDPEYSETAIHKLNAYSLNGFYPGDNLIMTWETHSQPLNLNIVRDLIKRYGL